MYMYLHVVRVEMVLHVHVSRINCHSPGCPRYHLATSINNNNNNNNKLTETLLH